MLGGGEIQVGVVDREESDCGEGGDAAMHLVAHLCGDTVEADIIRPHHRSGRVEGIVKASEGDRCHPIRVRTKLILEECAIDPDGVGAEIASLTTGTGRTESLVFRNRIAILSCANAESRREVVPKIHVGTEAESDPLILTLLGVVVSGGIDRWGLPGEIAGGTIAIGGSLVVVVRNGIDAVRIETGHPIGTA